jgi:hypothetical protein
VMYAPQAFRCMTVATMELLRTTVTAFQETGILQRTFVGFTTEG